MVSRETLHIALMLAALNALQVKAGDVLNTYFTAPVKEKEWTIHGPEFGNDSGKSAIIVHALYGLKSAGAAFMPTLHPFCTKWGTHPVRLTLTYGIKPRPDLTTRDRKKLV